MKSVNKKRFMLSFNSIRPSKVLSFRRWLNFQRIAIFGGGSFELRASSDFKAFMVHFEF
jgi:hypothetical protein